MGFISVSFLQVLVLPAGHNIKIGQPLLVLVAVVEEMKVVELIVFADIVVVIQENIPGLM